jgi:hypothetical protein
MANNQALAAETKVAALTELVAKATFVVVVRHQRSQTVVVVVVATMLRYRDANSGSSGGNNGNKNESVYGDNDFYEGCSSSLKVNIPKMNGNNYNEWAETVRLVLDGKGKLGFFTGVVAEPAQVDPHKLFGNWNRQA